MPDCRDYRDILQGESLSSNDSSSSWETDESLSQTLGSQDTFSESSQSSSNSVRDSFLTSSSEDPSQSSSDSV